MQRRRLGRSPIVVSDIGLGTMTFGTQCDEALSFRIMDRAFDAGIDFLDAAELYPVPPKADLAGLTEVIVGKWLKTKPREQLVIATKVAGPGHGWFTPPVRSGKSALDRRTILRAVDDSLQRLQTDYIDLYQTHWPDHGTPPEGILDALDLLVKQGKVRTIGCSNETCWGLMRGLWAADKHSLTRYETVQNNYSLINRRCESELAQVCRREGVSLIPYSPLGGGVLTGKYNETLPKGSRFEDYLTNCGERQKKMARRFVNDRTLEVARRLVPIAKDVGVSAAAVALAWSRQNDFVASTLVGATTMDQLEESLAAIDLVLSREIMERIDKIDEEIPCAMAEDGLRRL